MDCVDSSDEWVAGNGHACGTPKGCDETTSPATALQGWIYATAAEISWLDECATSSKPVIFGSL